MSQKKPWRTYHPVIPLVLKSWLLSLLLATFQSLLRVSQSLSHIHTIYLIYLTYLSFYLLPILVFQNCLNQYHILAGLNNKYILSQFYRVEVHDQGVSRFGFSGFSPWLMGGVCVCVRACVRAQTYTFIQEFSCSQRRKYGKVYILYLPRNGSLYCYLS